MNKKDIWEKILKMPTNMRGEKKGYFYLDKFPKLKELVFNTTGTWMSTFNQQRTMTQWTKRNTNEFRPRLMSDTQRGVYGKVNIDSWELRDWNVEFNEPMWGVMDRASKLPLERDASRGRHVWKLEPNEIGLTIREDAVKRPNWSVSIDLPHDTELVFMPEDVPLTNAEAAVLYIRTWYDDFSKTALKKQRAMMKEFGLGELVNLKHGENPIIMSLVEKGLFRLNEDIEKPANLRNFPEVTNRGRSVAPDMDKADFITGFKEEVKQNPNKSFLFIPEGIKEDDWFTA
tara:strand:- start:1347 stop:2207 length:861 start_codon:yes stop_codon:yes gene_type:complete